MITFVALPNKGCSTGITEPSAVIANNTNIDEEIRKRYESLEQNDQVLLDINKLKEDSKNPQIDKIMDIDKEDANQLNVRGTPTIFVNEKRLSVLSQKDLFDLVESEIYK